MELSTARNLQSIQPKVLVIDDEEAVRLMMGDFLEDAGYQVLHAGDGREGLAILEAQNPDLVLTDIRMPVMDGLEVVAAMKESAPSTPVIIISGTSLLENVINALRLGAWDYILKPIQNLEILHHTIQKALERSALLRLEKEYQRRLEKEVRDKTARLRTEIEARKGAQRQLEQEAFLDPLTQVGNRLRCVRDLRAFESTSMDGFLGLLLLDIDSFQEINAAYGCFFGDQLLKSAAARLSDLAGEQGFVYRVGGDEFAVLVQHDNAPFLFNLLQEIGKGMNEPFRLGAEEIRVHCSSGLKLAPAAGIDPERMINETSFAHQQSKREKAGEVVIYDDFLHKTHLRRLSLEKDMRMGLAAGEFSLSYQPIMDPKAEQLHGFEALLRWNNPRHGAVPPNEFIPIAEESGFISELGEWALENACRFWMDGKLPAKGMVLSINISGKQFHHQNLVPRIGKTLENTAMDSRFLRLEITETAIMANPPETIRKLEELRALGIKISLDDFGTGYSSLEYLRQFPIDILKIDMSFVQKMDKDPKTFELVKVMANIASVFGLELVAEGVETPAQKEKLKEIGGFLHQGFLYSRPLPEAAVIDFCSGFKRVF
ncbi:MAG: EAL domain-containing protein [Deltaproteobacteria bacterium]|nr:EAL domain-containing protein [Deltaproteobacteria bacterium]